jgi:ABC-type transporter Mla subunit MlaD
MASVAGISSLSDLIGVVKTQTEALASLPMTLVNLTSALRNLTEVVTKAGETVSAVNRVVLRVDALLEEIEPQARELITEMKPGLHKVATIINDPVMDEIPGTLASINRDIMPIVKAMADTQAKVAGIAATTDRMMGLLDDLQDRVSHLPGANLLVRGRNRRTSTELASGESSPS